MANVTITMTEEQLRLVNKALEEYFRLRLNQWWDFADDVCEQGVDIYSDSPNHDKVFDNYIMRRDLLKSTFEAIFRQLTISNSIKSQDSVDMIDMWETIRHWFWQQKPDEVRKNWTVDSRPPLHEGQYPLPTIKKEGD